jgi:hypothetical protein
MYSKKDKRRLYWLIDQYLEGKITERQFCDENYYCFGLELDYEDLTQSEYLIFSDLNKICSRFTEYEEDFKLDSNLFYNKNDLKERIKVAKISLVNL